jgi:glucose/arabinose dehydrogenase
MGVGRHFPALSAILIAVANWGAQGADLGTYKGCAANDGQFKNTQIYKGPTVTSDVASNGVLKFTFVKQADGSADVYFIQKQGTVLRYNGKAGTVDTLGTVTVDFSIGEYGLVGVAARNDFLKNPWLYFMYASKETGADSLSFRIARIKMKAGLAGIDNASEKVLVKIPRKKVNWHTAGDMMFDAYDDLWAAIGDNQQTDLGPGNTADLRGGILRIHPDESAKGYSVPAGNFGEKMAAYYKTQGKPDVAALFSDTAKVKPEIYVKGTRNAYTIFVDPVRRWLAWGDVGPDQGKVSEEANLVKEPVFAGWPYFAGEEDMVGVSPYGIPVPAGSTRAAPVNSSAVSGVRNLPPIREPIFARPEGCSMTGPIFRYDGSVANPAAFPPQFNRKCLVSGCDGFGFHLMTLDSAGDKISGNLQIFPTIKPQTLVDLKQGPDGVLYYVSWNQGLYKIEYTGTCKDETLLPEKTGCAEPTASNYDPKLPKAYNDPRLCTGGTGIAMAARSAGWLGFDRRSISVSAPGAHRVEILDLEGRRIALLEGAGPATHAMPALPSAGVYRLRAHSSLGEVQTSLSWLKP